LYLFSVEFVIVEWEEENFFGERVKEDVEDDEAFSMLLLLLLSTFIEGYRER
jgi:hypothetical protein